MARGAEKNAQKSFETSQAVGKEAQGNASQLYSQLYPQLNAESTHPAGLAPEDLNAMNTASQQSLGGSVAGATGQGDLEAARTRNAGGFAPAIEESAREGMRQNSKNALAIQAGNADLKERQKQAGLAGEAGLYGQNSQNLLGSMGIGVNAVDAQTKAAGTGWFQNMLGLINAGANAAGAYGKIKNGGAGAGD